jgi:asparagine synthase (glutamine-hydrolysing)
LGTDHREHRASAREVTGQLENVIYHLESYDPALVRNAVPTYLLSELASEHVKVVLTGEGADEMFAGYEYMNHLRSGAALHAECARLLLGLHAMNLQRLDRMTMAHGLEGRVPFLDLEFVDWAMRFDPRLKLQGRGIPEKRLLRAAAEGLVIREVLRRPKLDLADGAGVSAILRDHAERRISDRDLRRAYKRFSIDTPSTKEELLYRNIYDDLFPGTSAQRAVAKWRPEQRISSQT